ncbi:hypothetical protein GCM10010320_81250 [Streptomyces caelestis]|nr:hypothetical protein GCM10010320_81250 [Streptomyces caelestis]
MRSRTFAGEPIGADRAASSGVELDGVTHVVDVAEHADGKPDPGGGGGLIERLAVGRGGRLHAGRAGATQCGTRIGSWKTALQTGTPASAATCPSRDGHSEVAIADMEGRSYGC